MTRLTKVIKTDIKSIIREKAIKPKEEALHKKKQQFLLKALWAQIDKHDYQAWKMLPKNMYERLTITAYSMSVRDSALGRVQATLDEPVDHPSYLGTWMAYENLSDELKSEFKELIRETKDHDAYVDTVMTNLDVTLSSCTTVKKLREVWVNGAEIIDKALGQSQQSPTVYMPMVAIQTLDALVPLP